MSDLISTDTSGAAKTVAPQTANANAVAFYQVKPREDGRGPYRWAHVVKTPKGFAMGTIYRQLGDALTINEIADLQTLCDKHGFDLGRVA